LFLVSCKMETEVWINEDGSGKQQFTMDMSGMGGMASMFEDAIDEDSEIIEEKLEENIEEHLNEEKLMEIIEAEPEEGVLDVLKEPFTEGESDDIGLSDIFKNPMSLGEVDTTMIVYDILSESARQIPDAELTKNTYMSIQNKGEDEMNFTMGLSYDSKEDFEKTLTAFSAAMAAESKDKGDERDAGGYANKMQGFFNHDHTVDYKKGIVIIPEQEIDDDMSEGLGGDEDINLDDPQEKAMFEMMFGSSGITSIYHLPGEVEFSNDRNAKIEGNTITFFTSMMDLMEMEVTPKRIIKYKP